MRRYSDPIDVRSEAASTALSGLPGSPEMSGTPTSSQRPEAFIWHGRLYVVRHVLAHWRERRPWWRDALDPVPGQPTGIDVASREQHVWRVEASRGQAYSAGIFDLTSDGPDDGWRLVRVAD